MPHLHDGAIWWTAACVLYAVGFYWLILRRPPRGGPP